MTIIVMIPNVDGRVWCNISLFYTLTLHVFDQVEHYWKRNLSLDTEMAFWGGLCAGTTTLLAQAKQRTTCICHALITARVCLCWSHLMFSFILRFGYTWYTSWIVCKDYGHLTFSQSTREMGKWDEFFTATYIYIYLYLFISLVWGTHVPQTGMCVAFGARPRSIPFVAILHLLRLCYPLFWRLPFRNAIFQ